MAAAAARKVTKTKGRKLAIVDLDADQEVEVEDDPTRGIPLFEGLNDEVRIEVYRVEPIEEGTLGSLGADADEATIARRYGGGVYRVTAKGSDGKFGRKQRTVTIAGDPKFESKESIRRWKIKLGELPEERPAAAAPASSPAVSDIVALLQASHAQSMQFMQAQLQASRQEADQRAQAESRRAEEGRARDREFLTTMLAIQKSETKNAPPPADPMAMIGVLLKGLELGRDMGGGAGGEGDPVAALISNLPVMLPQLSAMMAGNQAQVPPGVTPANQQQGPQQQQRAPGVTLTGPIAVKLTETVKLLQAKGYEPEAALAAALESLHQLPNAKTPQQPQQQAAPAPAPAAAAAGGNGTSPPARATRKK